MDVIHRNFVHRFKASGPKQCHPQYYIDERSDREVKRHLVDATELGIMSPVPTHFTVSLTFRMSSRSCKVRNRNPCSVGTDTDVLVRP